MAKIVKLPSGISIDLEKGEINSPIGSGPRPISRNTSSYSYSYRHSIWSRFDDIICNIGNWFADNSAQITGILSIILLICLAIPFIIWLFSLGLFWGIIAGIFLGGIAYYAALIVVGIFIFVANIALAVLRYIFYSGVSFLISLLLMGSFIGYNYYRNSEGAVISPSSVENVSTVSKKYYCKVKSLNVRSHPNTNAYIIGTLKRNQIVDVLEISDGFAKIKCGSSYGYVSERYIKESY